jgi:hypothetical protein
MSGFSRQAVLALVLYRLRLALRAAAQVRLEWT